VADASPQRAYRAACPGCGAPVEFKSAQSTHAVCGYCQSTVVRQGDVLQRLGKMAELFDDHSLLQLGAGGVLDGNAFTLVGRLQYQYRDGSWTEWVALFDDGASASLSEDNGAYVFARPAPLKRSPPTPEQFRVGATTAISGQSYTVSSNEAVSLRSAQGELPRLPPLGREFAMVELRAQDAAKVLSIDYSPTLIGDSLPALTLGRPVTLDELKMTGLKSESVKSENGRQFDCPHCGAPVAVQLAQSKTITCASCNSLIDLRQGIGSELRHAEQAEPVRPLLALGSMGQLSGIVWQVVGFQHRMGHEPGDNDELFGWEEYLLYNARRGFSFLVDATDGWSLVKPLTGAPTVNESAQNARYQGTDYRLLYSYNAETTYAAGEFYWQVQRGQKSYNRDYAAGPKLLSMEQTPTEVTWSGGSKLDSELIVKGFKLEAQRELLRRSDASPVTGLNGASVRTYIFWMVLLLVMVLLLNRCTRCDPMKEYCDNTSRTSGGSYGGFSSGGGHK